MELTGDYTFDAPLELVWEALQDPDVLGAIMPGGEGFERVGEDEYAGYLNLRVGPVQGRFAGQIKLMNLVPPESYNMVIDGKGAPGFVKATGQMKLTEEGETTRLSYAVKAQIGGRLAGVGQRLLDASAKSITRQSLEELNRYLKTRVTAGSTGTESGVAAGIAASGTAPASYEPPAQSTVALNVARDVVRDLVPDRYRPAVLAVGAVVVVLILYRVFS